MNIETIKEIELLALSFRMAIETLRDRGAFDNDFSFCHFPHGCCGDASDLLGQFLYDRGIDTWYVCGTHIESFKDEYGENNLQSHAWLATADPATNYEYLIIDITGDQFNSDPEYDCNNDSAYVGKMDGFHELFETETRDIHPIVPLHRLGMAAPRLIELYNQIIDTLQR